ncbi:hypothetical protein OIV83_005114 [Microbotryomycetes sp. JL201]|nr:hypothetical protein OIV83_005114 [Microbotryomycetes sp. JL201]
MEYNHETSDSEFDRAYERAQAHEVLQDYSNEQVLVSVAQFLTEVKPHHGIMEDSDKGRMMKFLFHMKSLFHFYESFHYERHTILSEYLREAVHELALWDVNMEDTISRSDKLFTVSSCTQIYRGFVPLEFVSNMTSSFLSTNHESHFSNLEKLSKMHASGFVIDNFRHQPTLQNYGLQTPLNTLWLASQAFRMFGLDSSEACLFPNAVLPWKDDPDFAGYNIFGVFTTAVEQPITRAITGVKGSSVTGNTAAGYFVTNKPLHNKDAEDLKDRPLNLVRMRA